MRKALIRLMVLNIVLIVLTTLIPTVVYLHMFSGNIKEQVHRINQQMLSEFSQALDQNIMKEVIRITDRNFAEQGTNEPLLYPFYNDISGNTSRILAVSKQLSELKSFYPFLDSIDIYYKESNLLFMGSHACFMSMNTCDLGGRREWLDTFNRTNSNVEWLEFPIPGQVANRSVITYVRSFPFFSTAEGRQGMVAVNIDKNYVAEMLKGLRFSKERILWVMDRKGNVITSNVEDRVTPSKEVIGRMMQSNAAEGRITAKLNDEQSVISYTISPVNDWYYVSATSLEDYYKQSSDLRNIMVLTGALLLATNLAIGLVILNRGQRPIRTLFTQYSNELTEMKERWERNRSSIRQNYIDKLLHGHITAESERVEERLLDVNLQAEFSVSFVLSYSANPLSSQARLLLPYQIKEKLEALFTPHTLYVTVREEGKLSGMLLLAGKEPGSLLQQMVERMKEFGEVKNFRIASGRVYPCQVEHISLSYKEAQLAMEYSFLLEDVILSYDSLRLEERVSGDDSLRVLSQLEEAVRAGNRNKLEELIDRTVADMKNGHYSLEYCRNLLLDMVSSIGRGLKSIGYNPQQVFGCDVRARSLEITTLGEYEAWILSLAQISADKLDERKELADENLQNKVLQYIDNQLLQGISLESAASYVGLSSNYLSKLFRTMTGSSFIEYVTIRKMERAAKMLEANQLNVQEIADRLGYNSTPHFIRVFKDKYGCTPKQYQKQNASTASST